MQANNSAWSSPAIDVDYRALPGESQEDTYNQTDTVNRSSRQERWQQKSEYDVETAQAQKQPYRQQVDLQPRQRPASVARQRRKVNIRPAGQSMPNEARVVRQERPGQVGVNLRPVDTVEPRSNVVRALLVVFPFLRDWGGFL